MFHKWLTDRSPSAAMAKHLGVLCCALVLAASGSRTQEETKKTAAPISVRENPDPRFFLAPPLPSATGAVVVQTPPVVAVSGPGPHRWGRGAPAEARSAGSGFAAAVAGAALGAVGALALRRTALTVSGRGTYVKIKSLGGVTM